jgi:hypothetical protein
MNSENATMPAVAATLQANRAQNSLIGNSNSLLRSNMAG